MTTKEAMDHLKQAINEDRSYAWSWHCNIAVPFQDAGASFAQANEGAARVMQHFFNVDVRTFPEWQWCSPSEAGDKAP